MNFEHDENEEDIQDQGVLPEYASVIDKVRSISKAFRKSSVKNDDFLQKCMMEAHGREILLKIDMKVRWNSTKDMILRFLQVKAI